MDALNWVSLAVSKDKTRKNLLSVYRDKTCLVATDGHRLHLSNGLPEVEPHYINGYDQGEFPDYNQVIPKSPPTMGIEILPTALTHGFLAHFKRAVALAKGYDKQPCFRFDTSKMSEKGIKLIHIRPELKIEIEMPGVLCLKSEGPHEVGVNGKYLLDALMMHGGEVVKIQFHGELGPVQITSGSKKAIVMPMKL